MNLKLSLSFFMLFFMANVSCSPEVTTLEEFQRESDDHESAKHMSAHVITSGIVHFGMAATVLKTLQYALKNKDKSLLALPIAAYLGGMYLVYKTPQWTDTYLLKNKHCRTVRQNVLGFIGNMILYWPFGTLLSECGVLYDREKLKKEAKQRIENQVTEEQNSNQTLGK